MYNFKVLTLNTWGVFTPLACDRKNERMAAVGDKLLEGEFDIVMLEEIWTQADYQTICSKVKDTYPNHHYFHSGMIGSGTCIFSKHSILETFYQKYSVNGYAHKIQHGDWFGGKGVGMARIIVGKLHINVYVTHLHAQYSTSNDEYLSHRVAQAIDLSQFIRLTSRTCDVVLIGGDFNLDPSDLGYKIIKTNAALDDAWLTQAATPEDELGTTSDRPDNKYASKAWLKNFPNGQRLDYIMYAANRGFEVKCERCWLTMRQIPGADYPYSDHEGVAAELTVRERENAPGNQRHSGNVEKVFSDAIPILDDGMRKVKADQVFYAVAFAISIFGLIYSAGLTMPCGLDLILMLIRFLVTVACGYFFWMAVVLANWELNGLLAARKNINNILKSNPIMH